MKLLLENNKEKFLEYVEKYKKNIFPFLVSFNKEVEKINSNKKRITEVEADIIRYAIFLQWPIRKLEYSYMIKNCEELLKPRMKTLDTGCGVTPTARWFASKNCDAYGVDVDKNTIDYLLNPQSYLFDSNVHLSCQDMTSLDFEDNTFDLVTSISVLEHLKYPDDSKAISEMLRVLRPGGSLIMTVDFEPVREDFVYRKSNEPYNVITLKKSILEPFSDYVENKDTEIQVSLDDIKKFWISNWWPDSLYDKNLGRNYASIGLKLKKTDDDLQKLIFESDENEIKAKIINYYEDILKREPDKEGLEHHYQLIKFNKITLDELSSFLKVSDEYKNLQKLYTGFVSTTEGFGMYLDPSDMVLSKTIAFTGNWEPIETQFFKNIVTSGMNVIDIGANIGYFSMLFSKLTGPTGKVIAFEPSPRSFSFLEKNVKSSQIQNIIAINKAISDYSGTTKLFLSKENLTDNRIFKSQIYESDKNREITEVEVITLDQYIKDMRVDILKIDVQGAEMSIINGAKKTIMNNPNMQIIIEFWPVGLLANGVKPEKFLVSLQNLGFTLHDLDCSQQEKTPIELCEQYTEKSFTNLHCIRKK